jgi:uncharacterized protein YukE
MAERILVDPQELRDTSTAFHNASTDVEQVLGELRSAAFGLDVGAWTAGEDARMAPKFLQAEWDGRGRVGTRDRMGNTLTRAADAFERTDTTAVQQLMGMPGWMEMAPIAAAAVGFNSTAMSNLLPAPAVPFVTQNWTGGGPDWDAIIRIAFAVASLLIIAAGVVGIVVVIVLSVIGGGLLLLPLILAILVVLIGIALFLAVVPFMTEDEIRDALAIAAIILGVPAGIVGLLVALGIIATVGTVLAWALFVCFIMAVLYGLVRYLFPYLFPDWTPATMPTSVPAHLYTPGPPPSPIPTPTPAPAL